MCPARSSELLMPTANYSHHETNVIEINYNETKSLYECEEVRTNGPVYKYKDKREMDIDTEFCETGTLKAFIWHQNGNLFSEEQILEWFYQLVLEVEQLHKKNVIYKDIRPQNIILLNNFAKLNESVLTEALNDCNVTSPYLAPELRNRPHTYSFSSDIWALGCVLYEMCALRPPIDSEQIFDSLRVKFSTSLKNLVLEMMSIESRDRPTASNILERVTHIKQANVSLVNISTISRKLRDEFHQFELANSQSNCIVCKYLLTNAYQISCGCFVCETCITTMKSTGVELLNCPGDTVDCREIRLNNIRPDMAKRREVVCESLHCPFSPDCQEIVPVSGLRLHYESKCAHIPVICKYCTQSIPRGELQTHQHNECNSILKICQHCYLPFPRIYLEEVHLNKREPECASFKGPCVYCKSGCFDRETLETHSKICSNWTKPCCYQQFGCQVDGVEQALTDHYRTDRANHLEMMRLFVVNYSENVRTCSQLMEEIQSKNMNEQEVDSILQLVDDVDRMTSFMSESQCNMSNNAVLNNLMESVAVERSRSWPDGKFVWKVQQFLLKRTQARNRSDYRIVSESFYSMDRHMRLFLYPDGKDAGRGRYLSICVQFLPGVYDDCVTWPVTQSIKIELLNKQERGGNKTQTISATPSANEWQRPRSVDGNSVISLPSCLELETVECNFLHEDCLFLTCQLDYG